MSRIKATDIPRDLSGVDLLIDVRSPKGRRDNGEIASAIIISKTEVEPAFSGVFAGVAKDARIVVFCGSIAGSGPAVDSLQRLGFHNVADVDGGYAALRDHGIA